MRAILASLAAAGTLVVPAAEASAAGAAGGSLYDPGHKAHFAFLNMPVRARVRPSAAARTVASLRTRTPEHTDELVGVLARRTVRGREWLRVELPVRPTGATGWIPRDAVGELRSTSAWLRIDRAKLRASLVRAGRVVWSAPVGIGQARWPTPAGSFYIRSRLVPKDAGGLYGPLAFGTSAASRVLTDWPGGGYIGIHGTDAPGQLPGRVSHGCIRIRNDDIRALDPLMPVGTPVTIR
jgi:lipoprotein-anchoring transpeptidase ErfK/SrfK